MSSVPVRALLIVLATVVLAWTAVLLRNHTLGSEAAGQAFRPSSAGTAPDPAALSHLRSARKLDPDTTFDIGLATYLYFGGDQRGSTKTLLEVVRKEPENATAWAALRQVSAKVEPALSKQAAARAKRLDPFRSGG